MARIINPFEEEAYPPFIGMPADGLAFLRALKKNNNREWFEKNKVRFEYSLKEPFQSLLSEIGEQLRSFDPDIAVNPKKDLYRIYRDVRFSKDKSPYKSWIAAAFTFKGGNRKTDSCYYIHVGADDLIVGGGVWDQIPERLKNLRNAIDRDPQELRSIINAKGFKKLVGAIEGEALKTIPKGHNKDHPAADLLKMKQFLCGVTLKPEASLEKRFVKTAVDAFKTMTPFVRWLFENS